MRKKLLSNTYLKGVSDYIIKIDYSNHDYLLVTKKINKIDKPFILTNGLKLIDNNYYILEMIPKGENYCMRAYFDQDKKLLEYYFDIIKSSGIDTDNNIPYYDDLYLDIVVFDDKIEVVDENELLEAFKTKKISKETYNFAHNVMDNLIIEIKNKSNKYVNMNLSEML